MNQTGVSEPSCSTYFGTLPADVCVMLLEWLSTIRHLNSAKEQCSDAAAVARREREFLCFLFFKDGPFCNVAPSMITRLSLSPGRDTTKVSIENGLITMGPELFEEEELGKELAEQVLKACGESTKEIWLTLDDARPIHRQTNEYRFIQLFVSFVIQYCPAVESLRFRGKPRFTGENTAYTLIAAYSSRLRSIDWNLEGIGAQFCVPDFSNCTQIRQLSMLVKPKLMFLLKRTGSLLESLELTFDTFEKCEKVMNAIEENCKNLVRIRLLDSRRVINSVGEERYAAFLCSYGTQLIKAEIDGMVDPEHLFEVFTKCSNLNFENRKVEDSTSEEWELVRVFGPRIQNLEVGLIACTSKQCCPAISSCTTLSGLTIFSYDNRELMPDITEKTIGSVLSSLCTPSLKHLTLGWLRATKEDLAMVAEATSNLTTIELVFAEPVQDGSIFETIVNSNPHLREVCITESHIENGERDVDSALELLRVLVKTFSKCHSLMFSILNTGMQDVQEETIRDICGSLPCRGIELFVEIGSICYLLSCRQGHGVIQTPLFEVQ